MKFNEKDIWSDKKNLRLSKLPQRFYLNWSLTLKTKSSSYSLHGQQNWTLVYSIDKTWSSLSNSNLSQTSALGSLESLEFFLSLQRSFSLKFILGQKKKFGPQKSFWSEKILCPKTIMRLTKILV